MRALSAITDPVHKPVVNPNSIDRFFMERLKDKRDLPFMHLCIMMAFTLPPSAIVLYLGLLDGWMWWVHAVGHICLCALYFMGSFTLMLHNIEHGTFFKKEHNWGNYIVPWFLGFFMGQPPRLFYAHHIGMHHSEGNMPKDRSSTMPYQRDSFLGFLHYFFRFLFWGVGDVTSYFLTKGKKLRKRFLTMVYRGELLFLAICVGLCFLNWAATLFVFILPLLFVRGGMMSGNWGQHAFIDPDAPNNDYKNSITCINSHYNKICFNDGYHIGHHLYPNMHWTDMPAEFLKNIDKYIENDAIVFEGLDFHLVFVNLMLKRYDFLAERFVNLGNRYKSNEEVVAMLKYRTRRFSTERLASFATA